MAEWERRNDPNSGREFWINHATREVWKLERKIVLIFVSISLPFVEILTQTSFF